MAKLAGHMAAVCERYCVRIDMAVKAKELAEIGFRETGGRGHDVMQYVSLINRSERQRLTPLISYCTT